MDEIVVANGKRTPFGASAGCCGTFPPSGWGLVLRKVIDNLPVDERDVDAAILGLCLPGVGLSPARQAVLAAKFPMETNAFTVDRACCSALTAVGMSMNLILQGQPRSSSRAAWKT